MLHREYKRGKEAINRSLRPVFMLHYIQVSFHIFVAHFFNTITDLNKGEHREIFQSQKAQVVKKFLFILSRLVILMR